MTLFMEQRKALEREVRRELQAALEELARGRLRFASVHQARATRALDKLRALKRSISGKRPKLQRAIVAGLAEREIRL